MSVSLIDSMGSDLSVVNAARVSFYKESNWEKHSGELNGPDLNAQDQKLISYLARHHHWTPFAHTCLSFRVKAPIFVARQLAKHQVGLVWNEVSRRYVDDEPEFWFPEVWRGKPVNAKQGSDGVFDVHPDWVESIKEHLADSLQFYNTAILAGMAPEQVRMWLPQNTMTEWIWSGSLAAFARVCKQRLDPHAQQETREVAQQINDLVPDEFKYSWKALV